MNVRGWSPALGLVLVMSLSAAHDGAAQESERRGWLGFTYTATNDEPIVVVSQTYGGSPAARAGLRRGDEIVRWNGSNDVRAALQRLALEPGDTVRLQVRPRRGETRDVVVVATRRPTTVAIVQPDMEELQQRFQEITADLRDLAQRQRPALDSIRARIEPGLRDVTRQMEAIAPEIASGAVFGMAVRTIAGAEFVPMNDDLGANFGTDQGLLVVQVAPDTPAHRAGLRSGDVVVSAKGVALTQVDQLRKIVVGARDRVVPLEILRLRERESLELRWE